MDQSRTHPAQTVLLGGRDRTFDASANLGHRVARSHDRSPGLRADQSRPTIARHRNPAFHDGSGHSALKIRSDRDGQSDMCAVEWFQPQSKCWSNTSFTRMSTYGWFAYRGGNSRVAKVESFRVSESNSPVNNESTAPASFVSATLGSRVVLGRYCARPGRLIDPLSVLLVRSGRCRMGSVTVTPSTIVMGMPGVRSSAPSIQKFDGFADVAFRRSDETS